MLAAEWSFKHTMTGPYNSQSNSAAKAAVKMAKKIMIRLAKAKGDPYVGLLYHGNTSTEGTENSLKQRIFGQKTRAVIPVVTDKLGSDQVTRKLLTSKRMILASGPKASRELVPLPVGTAVTMDQINKYTTERRPEIVITRIDARSHEVQSYNAECLPHNRVHLRIMPIQHLAPETMKEDVDQYAHSPTKSQAMEGGQPIVSLSLSAHPVTCNTVTELVKLVQKTRSRTVVMVRRAFISRNTKQKEMFKDSELRVPPSSCECGPLNNKMICERIVTEIQNTAIRNLRLQKADLMLTKTIQT